MLVGLRLNLSMAQRKSIWNGEQFARSGGFTFSDLLVVVGVVMVLAALVVPVLEKHSEKAKQAQCTGNLKEITRAVLVYAEDSKGTLPYMEPSPPTGASPGRRQSARRGR